MSLEIKCRRGGCGTIIEQFWQFCPSCGTQVSFKDREAVMEGEAVVTPSELTDALVLSYLTIHDQMLHARHYAEEETCLHDLDRIWRQLTEEQRDTIERRLTENVLKEAPRERFR